MTIKFSTVAAALIVLTHQAIGQTVTVTTTAPTSDILSSNNTGTTYSRIKDEDSDSDHARGMTFYLGNGAETHYEITSITIHKNGNQTFSNDTMTLRIYKGTVAEWNTGTGHSTSNDGDDYYVDSTVTPLYAEAFTIDGQLSNNNYITFKLSTPLTVEENADYGFFFTYDGSGSSSPDYFQYNEGVDGGRSTITNTNHSVATTRHVRYILHGSSSNGGNTDSDNDGLPDAWEYLYFQDLDENANGNPDNDGVDNAAEHAAGTKPNDPDSDDDGLDDGVEIAGPTDPLDSDSDDDDLLDGVETGTGIFVSTGNTGTDPMLADSDGDDVPDGTEIRLGSDPFDASHMPTRRPNIIFIMIDDLDTREIGVYGQATLKTPRIDSMASQGMMFSNFYTASPVCHSCRSSLMTGQDTRRSQDRHNSGENLHPTRITIGEVLQQAGYTTGCVGKWGMGTSTGAPWNQGFDFFCGYLSQTAAHRFFPKSLWKNDQKIYFNSDQLGAGDSLYIAGAHNYNEIMHSWTDNSGNVCSHDVVVAEGLKFIEENADRPFFLYCAWTPPHAYMYPAATLAALTDEDGLVYDTSDLNQTMINEVYPGMPFGADADVPTMPDFNDHCYASMVSAADRDTGRIMDKLVELGIDDNTLVIFSSDNGEDEPTFLTSEHLKSGYADFRGAKRDCYEGGIRSPFVAWMPGTIEAGSSSDVIGTFADMLPTFAELAGISTPTQVTGRSILPVLLGGHKDDLQPRDYHYWYFTEGGRRWRAVRQGDWKIVRDRANNGSAPTYELFNLSNDPYETTDLSASETTILQNLIPLVEGTHEVTRSTYFKADDEFFTWSNLTPAAYQIGTRDGSGAADGYSLTASGTGSGFNYLPFSGGLTQEATFTWTMQFPSGGAASFLLGASNTPSQCLAVRINASNSVLEISYAGSAVTSTTLAAADFPSERAECQMQLNPSTGIGTITIGTTVLNFDLTTSIGPLQFWGYQVESSSTLQASRPRWSLETKRINALEISDGLGAIDVNYQLPFLLGQSITPQYSLDMETWYDNPPGLQDIKSVDSQGQVRGSWSLSKDSLLPRNHSRLFFRARVDP
ncbi:sulfatase-like hydrolase/transferase [Verrucomicrobiaceae bacterium R5-34]|nr:sulfatase-like hydrolase/transferase [Verrucomicrobiaceae bacterium R5-34]